MLIDTHCHLNFPDRFPDPEAAIAEAKAAGVGTLIVVGCDTDSSRAAVTLAERFSEIYAVVGWHPTYTCNYTSQSLAEIEQLLQHPKVVAIGEIGLDFHWDTSTPEQQHAALVDQLDLAARTKMPVVFHCREAYPQLLDILEARQSLVVVSKDPCQPTLRPTAPHLSPPRERSVKELATEPGEGEKALERESPYSDGYALNPYLFHCFAGTTQDAERALKLDALFGVDGPITYKNAQPLREVIQAIPLERLVIETDSPYMPPTPHRGKPNTPAYVKYINEALAQVKGVSIEECATTTTANAERFFQIP